MDQFTTIGLISRKANHQVMDTLQTLGGYLLARGSTVVLEADTAALLPEWHNQGYRVVRLDELGTCCDLVIVVGGDGSMLGAARALSTQSVPVLGINRGSLGFLTDISPDEIETRVAEVLSGDFSCEMRFLLQATVVRDGHALAQGDALNEVVLHRGASLRMIEFSLHVDKRFVYSQHSDGLVISTPTGSTAYALSGGGPIVHPSLDAIALVPMFPHTLTSRPIVVGGDSQLSIVLGGMGLEGSGQPVLSCDGQMHVPLQAGDIVQVAKKPERLQLVHPASHDFYETCRSKLGWGSRLV